MSKIRGKKRSDFISEKKALHQRLHKKNKKENQERLGDAVVALNGSSDDGYHNANMLIALKGNLKGQ